MGKYIKGFGGPGPSKTEKSGTVTEHVADKKDVNANQNRSSESKALRGLWENNQLTGSRCTAIIVCQYSQLINRDACILGSQVRKSYRIKYLERL